MGAAWPYIRCGDTYILEAVTKHLVDIDDRALRLARAELRTKTIKDTVNEALLRAADAREERVSAAIDFFAKADLVSRFDRAGLWRSDT